MKTEDALISTVVTIMLTGMIFLLTASFKGEKVITDYPRVSDTGAVIEFGVRNLQIISVNREGPVTLTIRSSKVFRLRNMQSNETINSEVSDGKHFLASTLPFGGWLVEAGATCYVTASPDPSNRGVKLLSVSTSQEGRDIKFDFLYFRIYPIILASALGLIWIKWLFSRKITFRSRPPRSSTQS